MRVALYGHGRMGGYHAQHLRALGHDAVVIDPERGENGDPEGVSAVVVATPTIFHHEVAMPWLQRGVPVLVEKPLAASVEQARELAGFEHCSVGHIERFNPAFTAVAGCDARFVQAERLAPWSERATDVDVVMDLMVHDLDLFLSWSNADIVEVRANGLSMRSGRIDIVHARVVLADGRVGVFAASRISRKAVRSLRIFSPDGYRSCDLKAQTVVRVDENLQELAVPVSAGDALRAELLAFTRAVEGGAAFPVSGKAGLRVIELAEAVRCACTSAP